MSDSVQRALREFLLDVRQLPNESAKSHRFSMLVSALFPGSKAISEVAGGIEKRLLRIDTASGTKRGRMDLYYGNAIIEFENSLKATGDEAERQLCEYTAGTWAKEGKRRRPLLCIASDGIVWKTYAPIMKGGADALVTAEAIELRPLREFTLTPESLHGFWIWLTTLLFRPGQMEPTTERFRIDFGSTSQAFADALISLRSAWNLVSSTTEAMTTVQTWQKYLLYT